MPTASREVDQIERRPPLDTSPLSPAQERLWFLHQLEPDVTFDNVPLAVRIEGPLNTSALHSALLEIVRRHEVLRTTFEEVEGAPRQRVHAPPLFVLNRLDLRERSDPVTEAVRLASREAQRPFDLERGPPLRALLLCMRDDDHVLVLTLHHIVCDAPSFGILGHELEVLYSALADGEPSPLPELPLQYADFALWQRAWLASEERVRVSEYWRRRLDGAPTLLELPTDRPRPRRRERPGRFYHADVPGDVAESLRSLAAAEGATLFTAMLALFGVLLSRYSRQRDLVVGVPSIVRAHVELEELVGCFLNVVCMRLDLGGDPTFRELLARVRAAAIEAYSHQELPFEELLAELDVERTTSHPPLVQVGIGMRPGGGPPIELRGCRTSEFALEGAAVAYDLFVDFEDDGRSLHGLWAFNDDVFAEQTIARMARHLEVLATEAGRRPDLRISELPLLTPRERETLLSVWNETWRPDPGRLVHDVVAEQARRRPDAAAVSGSGGTLSYGVLDRRAAALAAALRRLGVGLEAPVPVLVERSPALIVALLAVLRAGGAYVPLDPEHPWERLRSALSTVGARTVISSARVLERIALDDFEVVLADEPHDPEPLASAPAATPATLAYTIFTSGSTGRPKGVAVTHGALANLLAGIGAEIGVSPSDVLVGVTTISFDIAALELFLPLVNGAELVLATDEEAHDGRRLAALLDSSGATVLQATPATWQLLLDAGWEGRDGIVALCGGEALPASLAGRLAACTRLWNAYGPTETTIWSTLQQVEAAPEAATVPIGRPLANTRVYVLDERAEPLPIGVPGEIYIGGAGVARGYVRSPGLTAERFVPDPFGPAGGRLYRTGDLGRFLVNGSLEFSGRLDHQLKVRGFRVEPAEIERSLLECAGVREAVVVARGDAAGTRLVAYLSAGREITAGTLRAALARRLPDYMVPSAFVLLEGLPRNASGKIDRSALPEPTDARSSLGADFVPPAEGAEELIAEVWRDVLGVDRVGALDNFFELGGHSLALARIRFRLESIFGVQVPLLELFDRASVRAQAELVEELLIEEVERLSEEEAAQAQQGL